MAEPKLLSEAEVSAIASVRIPFHADVLNLAHTLQALRTLLREYGQHHDYCPCRESASATCVCGYDVARRRGLG